MDRGHPFSFAALNPKSSTVSFNQSALACKIRFYLRSMCCPVVSVRSILALRAGTRSATVFFGALETFCVETDKADVSLMRAEEGVSELAFRNFPCHGTRVPHTPGFPVKRGWAHSLHAAFLNKSRTRGT